MAVKPSVYEIDPQVYRLQRTNFRFADIFGQPFVEMASSSGLSTQQPDLEARSRIMEGGIRASGGRGAQDQGSVVGLSL